MGMVDDEAVETNTQRRKIDKNNNIPIKFHIRSRACVERGNDDGGVALER